MAAPFSYTHPSHIASGYRPTCRPRPEAEYPRKYPSPSLGYGEDYPMYHRDHCKMPPSNSNCCACVDELQEVQTRRPDLTYNRIPPDTHNGARTTHDIVAAYGVYSHSAGVAVEETGFESAVGVGGGTSYYPQQVVVVASQRDGTTANTLAREPTPDPRVLSSNPGCCRPAVPLVLVVFFVIVFLIVSGVLFYFNVVTYTPDSTMQGKC
ncbi:uncharacterized protein LOC124362383 [Homalodisca vitripennis]|uniref:uncharacterized protein LOC124362383 n=1 Tax=Homalodisca vitripennis TaxID=197043 RepID=UPI001EEBDBDF|nr:uncharacterized protein LOC124362383 [Homalodisca vitripennis]